MDSIDLNPQPQVQVEAPELTAEEIRAGFWALVFICAEISLGFILLREKLIEKEVLSVEDQELMDQLACQADQLQSAYGHMEKVFGERFNRVLTLSRNPEAFQQFVEQRMKNVSTTPEDKGDDDV